MIKEKKKMMEIIQMLNFKKNQVQLVLMLCVFENTCTKFANTE